MRNEEREKINRGEREDKRRREKKEKEVVN